jgi:hypothetical protein
MDPAAPPLPARPSPEWLVDQAIRLMSLWEEADDPEQYVDGTRADLAFTMILDMHARACGRLAP